MYAPCYIKFDYCVSPFHLFCLGSGGGVQFMLEKIDVYPKTSTPFTISTGCCQVVLFGFIYRVEIDLPLLVASLQVQLLLVMDLRLRTDRRLIYCTDTTDTNRSVAASQHTEIQWPTALHDSTNRFIAPSQDTEIWWCTNRNKFIAKPSQNTEIWCCTDSTDTNRFIAPSQDTEIYFFFNGPLKYNGPLHWHYRLKQIYSTQSRNRNIMKLTKVGERLCKINLIDYTFNLAEISPEIELLKHLPLWHHYAMYCDVADVAKCALHCSVTMDSSWVCQNELAPCAIVCKQTTCSSLTWPVVDVDLKWVFCSVSFWAWL